MGRGPVMPDHDRPDRDGVHVGIVIAQYVISAPLHTGPQIPVMARIGLRNLGEGCGHDTLRIDREEGLANQVRQMRLNKD